MNGSKIKIKREVSKEAFNSERLKWIIVILLTNLFTFILQIKADPTVPKKVAPQIFQGNRLLLLPVKTRVPLAHSGEKKKVSLLTKEGEVIGPIWLHPQVKRSNLWKDQDNLLLEVPETLITKVLSKKVNNLTVVPRSNKVATKRRGPHYEINF